jgi:hypothetical protein
VQHQQLMSERGILRFKSTISLLCFFLTLLASPFKSQP